MGKNSIINAMHRCHASLNHFTGTGVRLGTSGRHLLPAALKDDTSCDNREAKNAVFHRARAIHRRLIVSDKI
jgi:hypothetical protein